MNANKIERVIPTRNKYCFWVYPLYSTWRFRMDSWYCGSIVISLTFAHHHVKVIFMKPIENRISSFFSRFPMQWEESKKDSFNCTSLFSTFRYLLPQNPCDRYETQQEQDRRRKVVNREALRLCGGSWHSKLNKNSINL